MCETLLCGHLQQVPVSYLPLIEKQEKDTTCWKTGEGNLKGTWVKATFFSIPDLPVISPFPGGQLGPTYLSIYVY